MSRERESSDILYKYILSEIRQINYIGNFQNDEKLENIKNKTKTLKDIDHDKYIKLISSNEIKKLFYECCNQEKIEMLRFILESVKDCDTLPDFLLSNTPIAALQRALSQGYTEVVNLIFYKAYKSGILGDLLYFSYGQEANIFNAVHFNTINLFFKAVKKANMLEKFLNDNSLKTSFNNACKKSNIQLVELMLNISKDLGFLNGFLLSYIDNFSTQHYNKQIKILELILRYVKDSNIARTFYNRIDHTLKFTEEHLKIEKLILRSAHESGLLNEYIISKRITNLLNFSSYISYRTSEDPTENFSINPKLGIIEKIFKLIFESANDIGMLDNFVLNVIVPLFLKKIPYVNPDQKKWVIFIMELLHNFGFDITKKISDGKTFADFLSQKIPAYYSFYKEQERLCSKFKSIITKAILREDLDAEELFILKDLDQNKMKYLISIAIQEIKIAFSRCNTDVITNLKHLIDSCIYDEALKKEFKQYEEMINMYNDLRGKTIIKHLHAASHLPQSACKTIASFLDFKDLKKIYELSNIKLEIQNFRDALLKLDYSETCRIYKLLTPDRGAAAFSSTDKYTKPLAHVSSSKEESCARAGAGSSTGARTGAVADEDLLQGLQDMQNPMVRILARAGADSSSGTGAGADSSSGTGAGAGAGSGAGAAAVAGEDLLQDLQDMQNPMVRILARAGAGAGSGAGAGAGASGTGAAAVAGEDLLQDLQDMKKLMIRILKIVDICADVGSVKHEKTDDYPLIGAGAGAGAVTDETLLQGLQDMQNPMVRILAHAGADSSSGTGAGAGAGSGAGAGTGAVTDETLLQGLQDIQNPMVRILAGAEAGAGTGAGSVYEGSDRTVPNSRSHEEADDYTHEDVVVETASILSGKDSSSSDYHGDT